jgi:hypothetical protein
LIEGLALVARPYKSLQQSGHATNGGARRCGPSRVSQLLS